MHPGFICQRTRSAEQGRMPTYVVRFFLVLIFITTMVTYSDPSFHQAGLPFAPARGNAPFFGPQKAFHTCPASPDPNRTSCLHFLTL